MDEDKLVELLEECVRKRLSYRFQIRAKAMDRYTGDGLKRCVYTRILCNGDTVWTHSIEIRNLLKKGCDPVAEKIVDGFVNDYCRRGE